MDDNPLKITGCQAARVQKWINSVLALGKSQNNSVLIASSLDSSVFLDVAIEAMSYRGQWVGYLSWIGYPGDHWSDKHPKGQGHGTSVLAKILAKADALGIDVVTTPAGGAKYARLVGWYMRHGFFEPIEGKGTLVRNAKGYNARGGNDESKQIRTPATSGRTHA